MSKNKKASALILDKDTNEELVSADLTLATVKRMAKYYATFGISTRAIHDGVEVSA